jgi:hypothetical protein
VQSCAALLALQSIADARGRQPLGGRRRDLRSRRPRFVRSDRRGCISSEY